MNSTRNTRQKKIIMDALLRADHPTASELYEEIRKDYPSISRATVFRVLSRFAESGEVTKLSLAESSARFDACVRPHAHLHCMRCGKVFDADEEELDLALGKKEIGGFTVCSARLEFIGYCKNCKNKIG